MRVTFPPERLNGTMISGSAPSEKSEYTYPRNLKEQFRFQDDAHEKRIFDLKGKKRKEAYRKKLVNLILEQTERRCAIFKELNEAEDYDFSIFWIEETDIIQHMLWEYRDSLLQFYIGLDDILRDILLTFPNRNFVVVSDHGFESRSSELFYVNAWLKREGYLRQSSLVPIRFLNFALSCVYEAIASVANDPWRFGKLLAFLAHLGALKHTDPLKQKCVMQRVVIPGIDKEKSKAYLYTSFGIKVNSSGSYEEVREEIIGKLRRLEDQRGQKVLRDVWKREEVYVGKCLRELPDIVFLTSEKYIPFPALARNLFSTRSSKAFWWRSGDHARARDGILAAYGPQIGKGRDLGIAEIEDVFPTILHLMGCAIPEHVDGHVLTRIFEEDSEPLSRRPRSQKSKQVYMEARDLAGKDAEKIRRKLRELGYM